jgi:hypothetical protein
LGHVCSRKNFFKYENPPTEKRTSTKKNKNKSSLYVLFSTFPTMKRSLRDAPARAVKRVAVDSDSDSPTCTPPPSSSDNYSTAEDSSSQSGGSSNSSSSSKQVVADSDSGSATASSSDDSSAEDSYSQSDSDCSSDAVGTLQPHVSMRATLQLMFSDAAYFFSIVPLDILNALHPFVWRSGCVKNPGSLQLDRTIQIEHTHKKAVLDCFDPADNLVLVSFESDEVSVCGRDGKITRKIDYLWRPYACVVDSRGRLFVSAHDDGEVNVFSLGEDGHYECEYTIEEQDVRTYKGLALSMDELVLYVAALDEDCIQLFGTDDGGHMRDILCGQIKEPDTVAVLSNGNVVVSVTAHQHGAVRIFTADCTLIRCIDDVDMMCGVPITLDADDNLYVCDLRRGGLVVFSADGLQIGYIEVGGGVPAGAMIDRAGTVALANYGCHEVRLFKSQSK